MKKKTGSLLRCEFPIFQNNQVNSNGILKPLVYLDSAASAQKPASVIQAMTKYLEYDYGSVHRGAYGISIRSSQIYESVRAKTAEFISSSLKAEQVIFTKNTTESLNILASGFADEYLTEGSRIVIPMSEHHSNLVPWQQAALRKNCELAYIPLSGKQTKSLKLNMNEAKKLITENTKVVSLASMGNVLGQINPLQEIVYLAKKVGAFVIADCAQSMTCLEEDLFALGVDAIAFSGHKIYGPSGVGVLALSADLLKKLPPFIFGGGMISNVTLEGSEWASGPAKFEGGTPPVTEVAGLGAAIDWIESIGRKNLHIHAAQLASLFLKKLKEVPDIDIYSPETGDETIVSFCHRKVHAHDLVTILDTDNIAMRAGHHCAWPLARFLGVDALVRCSFAAYSDEDDVFMAIEGIKKALRAFA